MQFGRSFLVTSDPSELDSYQQPSTPSSHPTGIWGQPARPNDDFDDYSYSDDDLRLIKKPSPTPSMEQATERDVYSTSNNEFFMPFPKEDDGYGFTGVMGGGGFSGIVSLQSIITEEKKTVILFSLLIYRDRDQLR